jgi:hypothetical protein
MGDLHSGRADEIERQQRRAEQAERERDKLAEALRAEREAANVLVDAAQSAIDGVMFNQDDRELVEAAREVVKAFDEGWPNARQIWALGALKTALAALQPEQRES